MFKGAFGQRGFTQIALSRSVGGSATPSSALIPWNSSGAYMAATLGIPAFSYAPYAVSNIVRLLLAIAFAYANLRMQRSGQVAQKH
jgi:NhaC family Na+:H+ antiporter